MTDRPQPLIDWTVPAGRQDWLMGTGAEPSERALVQVAAAASVLVLLGVAAAQDVAWTWWQWLLVLALTVDVAGGVVANALGTAKRLYHSPFPARTALRRVVCHPAGFAALHVHPFALAALMTDATLAWAATWYAVPLAGTLAVVAAPLHLRRPLAAAVVTAAVIGAPLVDAPQALAWFGPVLVLKLVASHAVPEEPYRPSPRHSLAGAEDSRSARARVTRPTAAGSAAATDLPQR
jgi:hypothetical protein